jgi:hypothetical protein
MLLEHVLQQPQIFRNVIDDEDLAARSFHLPPFSRVQMHAFQSGIAMHKDATLGVTSYLRTNFSGCQQWACRNHVAGNKNKFLSCQHGTMSAHEITHEQPDTHRYVRQSRKKIMQHTYDTDHMIEQLVSLDIWHSAGVAPDVLRRTLKSLVALAKSEQLLQMRRDVASSVGITKQGER